ncbi:MAG TPA: hypothetical protein VMD98_05220 [Bryocella sp.]|nr:hypothetical protein [Bryocella sp.]
MGSKRAWLLASISALLAMPVGVRAQSAQVVATPAQASPSPLRQPASTTTTTTSFASSLQPLLDFKDSDVKFNLQTLMNTLRDNRHEGWVLAAYPDPKTSRPLIGAGFSLDLPAREHPQTDPLNPNQFLEPSSAQLWQAAGLEPARLETMLEQYDRELAAWKKNRFRRKIRTHQLFPEIEEEDAMKLLRVSAIQAIYNARAYCRNFDQLTGPQQMALTQLVFQMGVNLEEFTQFLFAINHPGSPGVVQTSESPAPTETGFTVTTQPASATAGFSAPLTPPTPVGDLGYWKSVQETLIHSDWARRYSTRSISVIAMLDPNYELAPWEAEAKVRAEVHPLRRRHRRAATVRRASVSRHRSSTHRTHQS